MSSYPVIRLGVLYPDDGSEGINEYLAFANSAPVALEVRIAYTLAEGSLELARLLHTGSTDRLLVGASELATWEPHAVMWACTSGSFLGGVDGAWRQIARIQEVVKAPTGSTSIAFGKAATALKLRRVVVLAPYPKQVTDHFVKFLNAFDVEVVKQHCLDLPNGRSCGLLPVQQLLKIAEEIDVPESQALLFPCTSFSGLSLVEPLEALLGKPVLTANQVTLWQGMRLAGVNEPGPGFGALGKLNGKSSIDSLAEGTPGTSSLG